MVDKKIYTFDCGLCPPVDFDCRYSIPWKFICNHHSAAPNNQSWEVIRKYHIEERQMADIAYNAGIGLWDGKWQVKVGRDLAVAGAHALGWNKTSIGICFLGDYDKDNPNPEQYEIGLRLNKFFMDIFEIPVDNIIGHVETWTRVGQVPLKSCPGTKFSMDKFREDLKKF